MTQTKISYYETTSRSLLSLCFHALWWYRFQNSRTVRDIDLKFGIVIVFGILEDHMHQGMSTNYVILYFFEIFLEWRFLWTVLGRKPCMWTSIFPNTVCIPNFKSISLAVGEIWKRFHQMAQKINRSPRWCRSYHIK